MPSLPHDINTLKNMPSHSDRVAGIFRNVDFEREHFTELYGDGGQERFATYGHGYNSGASVRLRYYARRTLAAASLVSGKKVLDVGCAHGTQVLLFAASGAAQVTGIDINPVSIDVAQRRAKGWGASNVQFVYDTIFNVTDQYDVIFAMETIHHIVPFDGFFAKATQLLKSGGKLIIAEPNGRNPFIDWRLRHKGWATGQLFETGGHIQTDEQYRLAGVVAAEIKKAGLKLCQVEHYRVLPGEGRLSTALKGVEPILERLLPMSYFGVGYTVIGQRT